MITNNDIKKIKSLSSRRGRRDLGVFIAEGDKLISELSISMELVELFEVGVNCSEAQMARISQLKTPTPMLALFRIPMIDSSSLVGSREKILVLDSVQDPGNLGTILRTADWFGVHTIICSEATVDVFSPKVVQATMGSIGRTKVVYTNLVEWLKNRVQYFPNSLYGTFLENSSELGDVKFMDNATIIMGNEGNGISSEVAELIDNRVFIARGEGGCGESLNVSIATAVILSRL